MYILPGFVFSDTYSSVFLSYGGGCDGFWEYKVQDFECGQVYSDHVVKVGDVLVKY